MVGLPLNLDTALGHLMHCILEKKRGKSQIHLTSHITRFSSDPTYFVKALLPSSWPVQPIFTSAQLCVVPKSRSWASMLHQAHTFMHWAVGHLIALLSDIGLGSDFVVFWQSLRPGSAQKPKISAQIEFELVGPKLSSLTKYYIDAERYKERFLFFVWGSRLASCITAYGFLSKGGSLVIGMTVGGCACGGSGACI